MIRAALVVLLLFTVPAGGAQDATFLENWPSFRGPGGGGVVEGLELPESFNAPEGTNLAWRVEIPGLAHSSPIVWGDRVFVTTVVSGAGPMYFEPGPVTSPASIPGRGVHQWKVLALDRATGAVVWERNAVEAVPKTGRHPKSSFSNATPATDGEHLVAILGSQGMFCFDLEGNLLWRVDLGVLDAGWFFDPTLQWGSASSPVIWNDRIIVQVDVSAGSFIAAFDVSTGNELWRTPRDGGSSWSTPAVFEADGRAEIVANGSRAIRAYDPATGAELWSLAPTSLGAAPSPVFGGGLVIVTSGYRPVQPIYAVRWGATGTIDLSSTEPHEHVNWSSMQGGSLVATPIVIGDYVYLLSHDGVLTCFDLGTGLEIYAKPVDELPPPPDADEAAAAGQPPADSVAYTASPVASNGLLFIAGEDGQVRVVRSGPLLERVSVNPVGEPVLATPAISGGMLFVRGRSHLFAFSR